MRITCIGSQGYDSHENSSVGFIVEQNGTRILLEASTLVSHSLVDNGFRINDFDAVFVSHDHADHAGGLLGLLHSSSFESFYGIRQRNKKLLIIIGKRQDSCVANIAENVYPHFFSGSAVEGAKIIEGNGRALRQNGMQISVFPLVHPLPVYGAVIKTKTRKVCYLPDTTYAGILQNIPKIRQSDLVIAAAYGSSSLKKDAEQYGFSTADEIAAVCKTSGVKRLGLFHCFQKADITKAIREAEDILGNGMAFYFTERSKLVL